jgi:hypothetical protein
MIFSPSLKLNACNVIMKKDHFDSIVIENYAQITESGKSGELYNLIQISSLGKAYWPRGSRLMYC